MEFCKTE